MKKNELGKGLQDTCQAITECAVRHTKKAHEGFAFMIKVARLIPDSWDFSYEQWGCVRIVREPREDEGKASAEEFRQVCKHVERITSKPLTRSGGEDYSTLIPYLRGSCYFDNLSIVVQLGNPNCKIEYVNEIRYAEPEGIVKVAVIPKSCLGLEDNGQ